MFRAADVWSGTDPIGVNFSYRNSGIHFHTTITILVAKM
jgi:hypothetical protein